MPSRFEVVAVGLLNRCTDVTIDLPLARVVSNRVQWVAPGLHHPARGSALRPRLGPSWWPTGLTMYHGLLGLRLGPQRQVWLRPGQEGAF